MSIMDLGRSTTDMEWFHGKILGKYHIYAFVSSESPVKVLQICSSFTGNSYETPMKIKVSHICLPKGGKSHLQKAMAM